MTPVSVVCWRWSPKPDYRSTFGPETVNTLRAMVRRHYRSDVRFICVTDDTQGLDPGVEVIPDWKDHVSIPSPHGGKNPSCYRRLRMFAPDIASAFGSRFVSLDLDTVITGDLNPLWDRSEDFVIWGDTNPRTPYNGSMMMMNAGARPQVWTQFDPRTSPKLAMRAGFFGSDQGFLSYILGPNETKWGKKDGVYSFRNDLQEAKNIPANCRIVFFHGRHDPWTGFVQTQYPWVKAHYGLTETAVAR